MPMGPLQLAVTWYKIRHAGEQAVHWDIQNKATSSKQICIFFVLDVPVRSLLSSMADFVPCDRQLQRAYLCVEERGLVWVVTRENEARILHQNEVTFVRHWNKMAANLDLFRMHLHRHPNANTNLDLCSPIVDRNNRNCPDATRKWRLDLWSNWKKKKNQFHIVVLVNWNFILHTFHTIFLHPFIYSFTQKR